MSQPHVRPPLSFFSDLTDPRVGRVRPPHGLRGTMPPRVGGIPSYRIVFCSVIGGQHASSNNSSPRHLRCLAPSRGSSPGGGAAGARSSGSWPGHFLARGDGRASPSSTGTRVVQTTSSSSNPQLHAIRSPEPGWCYRLSPGTGAAASWAAAAVSARLVTRRPSPSRVDIPVAAPRSRAGRPAPCRGRGTSTGRRPEVRG